MPPLDVVRRVFLRCAVGLLIAIPCFVGVLTLSLALPVDGRITARLKDAVDDGLLSVDSQKHLSDYGQGWHSYDMFSECLGLGINLGNTDQPAYYRAIATPYISFEFTDSTGRVRMYPCRSLVNAVETRPRADYPYFRFWHGYQVYYRLLLPVLGFARLRMLNAILLYGAILYFCFKLKNWFGWVAVPIVLLPNVIFTDLLSTPLLAVHTIPLACTYHTVALAMEILERDRGVSEDLFVFAFLSGAVYNFLSMLFTPELTAAWLALVCLAAYMRWNAGFRPLRAILAAGGVAATWFAGFTLTWIAKWTLSVAELGKAAVLNSVSTAASGVSYDSHNLPGMHQLFRPTLKVLGWQYVYLILACLVVTAAVLMFQKSKGRLGADGAKNWLLLQFPCVLVVGWVEVMRYHSVEHSVFAQRALLMLAILPLLGLLAPNLPCETQETNDAETGGRAGALRQKAPKSVFLIGIPKE
jgi:hypothetical protein